MTRLERLREMLEMGERLHVFDVMARLHVERSHAARLLRQVRDAVHIVDWHRREDVDRGPWSPVFAFGQGEDKKRPRPMSAAKACKRWRDRHPMRAAIAYKKSNMRRFKNVRPLYDPIIAALTAHRRTEQP